jgi:galactose mutarotase-like enzyme
MIYELKSSKIAVKIKSKGAELASFFDLNTEIEHIWQANPVFWNRHAPVLFPIVGQVEDGEYFVDGQQFELSQHGFARDMEFQLVQNEHNTMIFELIYNENSLQKYPFKFKFSISYTLLGSKLYIGYKVENLDAKTMYFQLGAHPGFAVPFLESEKFSDYHLKFDKKLTEDRLLFENGLLNGKITKSFLENEDVIILKSATFDEDALIFESQQIESVLITKNGQNGLKVTVKDFPLLGIWSKPKADAPFVCIEPWFGVASVKGQSKELKDKKAIQKLATGSVFECGFAIETQ